MQNMWSPYRAAGQGEWTIKQVAHLYRRAGFGPSYQQLQEGVNSSPEELVEQLFRSEPESFSNEMKQLDRQMRAGGSVESLPQFWLYRMAKSEAQLLEKTTLFWHGHFATSAAKVDEVAMMLNQNQMLRQHALQTFAPMVQGISKDPAMLTYLDSKVNRKTRPNENYARELMELFCLGLGNYTEDDIKQVARAFTGWEIRNDRFRFNKYQHDSGIKRFLGASGEFGGEEAVKIVLNQKSSTRFIASKLIQYFVTDESLSEEQVKPIADELTANGFHVGKAIRKILSSQFFYQSMGKKVRSPVELGVGLLRGMEATGNFNKLSENLRDIGQLPFFPPNVKGWTGGRSWINSATLLGRVNLVGDLIENEKTKYKHSHLAGLCDHYAIKSDAEILQFFEDLFFARPIEKSTREKLLPILKTRKISRQDRIGRLLFALGALPEFQLA